MRVIKFQKNKNVTQESKKHTFNYLKKVVPLLLIAGVIFGAGWALGSGTLQLRGYSPVATNKNLPSRLDYSSVDDIYSSIKENFDGKLNESDLLDGIKVGLANATGDPYTEYFSPKDAKEFYGQLNGTFEGIGAELGKNEAGNIIIIAPIAGFPAEKAGLKSKDIIAEIDDKTTAGFTIDQAVKKIRGKASTSVKLTIIREGAAKEINVTRETITIPSVKSEIRGEIGILTVSRFGSDTTDLATKAAQDFKSRNVKAVVLDLRGDPGGLVTAAVGVSSLWLPRDKIIFTARREKVITETTKSTANGDPILGGLPTIVLIDGGSASASEITASALRDNNVATLLGLKSFGKGSEQQPMDVRGGGLLKVTIAHWYTPAGKNIDKEGLVPDKEIKISEEDIKNKVDPQLDAALAQLKG